MKKNKFISWDQDKDYSLVRGGFLYFLINKLGLCGDSNLDLLLRALTFALLSWLPLLVFSVFYGTFFGTAGQLGFGQDFLTHLRLLVVVPFLVWVEKLIDPAFSEYMNSTRRIIPRDEEEKFGKLERFIDKLLNSWLPDILFLLLIYFFYLTSLQIMNQPELRWYDTGDPDRIYYYAISLPIYQFLFFRWLWRWFIWAFSVVKISRMNLQIEASHADQMAGLEYLSLVPLAFCVMCLAPAIVFSAMIGEEILYTGTTLTSFGYHIFFFVISIPIIVHLPLLTFMPLMIRIKARGITRFGSLIQYHNNLFKEKWMEGKLPEKESILPSLDNSSMADLNGSYQQAVQGMQLIPISRRALVFVALMLLVPFLPLAFTMYSLGELFSKLAKIVKG